MDEPEIKNKVIDNSNVNISMINNDKKIKDNSIIINEPIVINPNIENTNNSVYQYNYHSLSHQDATPSPLIIEPPKAPANTPIENISQTPMSTPLTSYNTQTDIINHDRIMTSRYKVF